MVGSGCAPVRRNSAQHNSTLACLERNGDASFTAFDRQGSTLEYFAEIGGEEGRAENWRAYGLTGAWRATRRRALQKIPHLGVGGLREVFVKAAHPGAL